MSAPEVEQRTPWGFRVMVGLAAAYLVLRFVQIGAWVAQLFG